ncbi:uroporphyrinogen decarboxylase family protein [Clostridium coskatii]|uniref:Uroporphyrinogen decarboxylase n=1 Tax=Clostridium coskatii TaxID=1705578 RepID=A0A162LAM6_9CLOT|nr:uroporphyrinogen decarboxylase family protein [Clostridium coskatii]OAA91036.1 Uroporphyrinogen decarboxylase [Clostridium coskatii]OBR97077.1 uroporphyrinogen decarboxylase [Clostridium coskatii]
MNTVKELYNERLSRIKKAIKLEKTDRTPVIPFGDSFFAKATGVKLSDFALDLDISNKVILDGSKQIGNVDAVPCAFAPAPLMGSIFFSNLKLPGRELIDDMLWQIDERQIMTTDDYDTILSKGFEDFKKDYFAARINVDSSVFCEIVTNGPKWNKNMRDEGYPIYNNVTISHPIDYLSGGRTLSKFMMDMRRMPEKIQAVMDIIADANIKEMKQAIKKTVDPISVFIAMGRGCPDFYSTELWEKFIWKYLKKITDAIIETGVTANFHADANWERGLDYFKDFPKGTCVFETDGTTDIYKIKKKLGGSICIKGDVQAAKLVLGTPDEVYNYSTQLIKDMGNGFILSSGCSIPPNAKVENVKAMVSAAAGK